MLVACQVPPVLYRKSTLAQGIASEPGNLHTNGIMGDL